MIFANMCFRYDASPAFIIRINHLNLVARGERVRQSVSAGSHFVPLLRTDPFTFIVVGL